MKISTHGATITAATLALVIAGCTGGDGDGDNADGGGDSVTLSFAHWLPGDTPQSQQYERISELVEERSGGSLTIEVFPGGQLGNQRDTLEGLQAGTIDMTKADDGYLVNYVSHYAVMSLPFLFDGYDHLASFLDSDTLADLDAQLLDDTGLRTLGWGFTGFRHFYMDAAVTDLDGFRGKNIRAPEIDVYIDTISSLGASPTPMPWGEVYLGLETGLINGFESSPADALGISAPEVLDHVILTNHMQASAAVVISESTWERLSEEHQEILVDVVAETTLEQREAQQIADEEAIATMESEGMQAVEFTAPDELLNAVRPVWDDLGSDPDAAALIDQILRLAP